jgi:5-deoxy-glucuronate isomerase
MSKVFGYPTFDENGEKILTTYDNEYSAMMMDIRVYRMQPQTTRTFAREGEEIAVLLLSGTVTYQFDENRKTVSRKDVFTDGPWCVHASSGTAITVTAETESQILVQCTKNDRTFAAKLYAPEDAPWGYSSVGKFGNVAKRRVNTIFDHDIAP